MRTTFSEQQATYLSDFNINVRDAIAELTHKIAQESSAIKNSSHNRTPEDNFERLADHCQQVQYWCNAFGAFCGIEIAQEEIDWDILQPDTGPAADEERDCALRDFAQLIAIATSVLDEITWLQSYLSAPPGIIPTRQLKHWHPDRFGIPEVRYELSDLQDCVDGWEKLDPECDALIEQYATLWSRIRSVANEIRPPTNPAITSAATYESTTN